MSPINDYRNFEEERKLQHIQRDPIFKIIELDCPLITSVNFDDDMGHHPDDYIELSKSIAKNTHITQMSSLRFLHSTGSEEFKNLMDTLKNRSTPCIIMGNSSYAGYEAYTSDGSKYDVSNLKESGYSQIPSNESVFKKIQGLGTDDISLTDFSAPQKSLSTDEIKKYTSRLTPEQAQRLMYVTCGEIPELQINGEANDILLGCLEDVFANEAISKLPTNNPPSAISYSYNISPDISVSIKLVRNKHGQYVDANTSNNEENIEDIINSTKERIHKSDKKQPASTKHKINNQTSLER
ncbi:MAG: hypothetical protein LBL47_03630 [Lactobacillus sp.]|jgi:hypothetical protein|nr:hypothetical protein [Lactobacillus sp.]